MSIITDLRALVFQRRIARATERIADALDELRTLARSEWQRKSHAPGRPIRMTEVQPFDYDAANESWRKEQEVREVGGVLED